MPRRGNLMIDLHGKTHPFRIVIATPTGGSNPPTPCLRLAFCKWITSSLSLLVMTITD